MYGQGAVAAWLPPSGPSRARRMAGGVGPAWPGLAGPGPEPASKPALMALVSEAIVAEVNAVLAIGGMALAIGVLATRPGARLLLLVVDVVVVGGSWFDDRIWRLISSSCESFANFIPGGKAFFLASFRFRIGFQDSRLKTQDSRFKIQDSRCGSGPPQRGPGHSREIV